MGIFGVFALSASTLRQRSSYLRALGIVGLVGSLVGGFLVSFFDTGIAGFWGSIVVAFLGACVFIAIVRAISGRRVA